MSGFSDAPPVSVVVCDDVPEMRSVLHDVLSEDDSVTILAEVGDGHECVRTTAELQPDVLLLDLSMPGMDGIDAIPLIMTTAPRTGIIVFSGLGAGNMQELAMARGADLYIEKGTPLDELRTAVRDVATRRSHSAEPGV
jgi:DNA-binding NarL/FixJ family response regulator